MTLLGSTPQFQQVWDVAWESAILTSSQVLLLLLPCGFFKNPLL